MGRTKKATQDSDKPTAPKRPLSAFFLFKGAMYEKVKQEHPDAKMTEITKMIGHLWSEADEETKKKYEQLQEEKKKQYEGEIQQFEEKYGKQEKKKASKHKSDDENDEHDKNTKKSKRVKKNK